VTGCRLAARVATLASFALFALAGCSGGGSSDGRLPPPPQGQESNCGLVKAY
jgi:hypothetical protein